MFAMPIYLSLKMVDPAPRRRQLFAEADRAAKLN